MVQKSCRSCIYVSDCKELGDDLPDDDFGCVHYDGLLLSEVPDDRNLKEDEFYELEEVGFEDFQVYEEGFGWVKVNPSLYHRGV